jgi:hypothetical protein
MDGHQQPAGEGGNINNNNMNNTNTIPTTNVGQFTERDRFNLRMSNYPHIYNNTYSHNWAHTQAPASSLLDTSIHDNTEYYNNNLYNNLNNYVSPQHSRISPQFFNMPSAFHLHQANSPKDLIDLSPIIPTNGVTELAGPGRHEQTSGVNSRPIVQPWLVETAHTNTPQLNGRVQTNDVRTGDTASIALIEEEMRRTLQRWNELNSIKNNINISQNNLNHSIPQYLNLNNMAAQAPINRVAAEAPISTMAAEAPMISKETPLTSILKPQTNLLTPTVITEPIAHSATPIIYNNSAGKKMGEAIPIFDSTKMRIIDWIQQWKGVMVLTNWTDGEVIGYVISKLPDNVKAPILQAISHGDGRFMNAEGLFQYLKEILETSHTPAMEELSRIKQQVGETASQLRLRMEILMQRMQAEGTNISEQQLVRFYVKALQEPLGYFMLPLPGSLKDAAMKASQLEELHKSKAIKLTVTNQQAKVIYPITTGQNHANLGRNQSKITLGSQTNTNQGFTKREYVGRSGVKLIRYFNNGRPMCGHCHMTGHIANSCNNKARGTAPTACQHCGKTTHPSPFCTEKKDANINAINTNVTTELTSSTPAADILTIGTWGIAGDTETDMEANDCYMNEINNINQLSSFKPVTVFAKVGLRKHNKIILDSGASVSVANTDFIKAAIPNYNSQLQEYKGPKVIAATGQKLNIQGTLVIPIVINLLHINVTVLVADDLPHALLLGVDEIYKNKMILDFGTHTVYLPNQSTCRFSIRHNPTPGGRTIEYFTIPPEHVSVIWVSAPMENNREKRQWIVEAIENAPVAVANTLVQDFKNTGKVPIQIMNLSNKNIEIGNNQQLVKFAMTTEIGTSIGEQKFNDVVLPTEEDIKNATNKSKLNDDHKQKLQQFLMQRRRVFSQPTKLAQANVPPHTIKTTSETPLFFRPYRNSQAEQEEIDTQVQGLLNKGCVRPSTSPWAAPVVLAKKKDGTWRFCIDYRGLNNITIRDMYPIPRIDDALDALSGAKLFSTLDAWTGYWQVPIAEEDRAKTGFVTKNGHWEWIAMPMGLTNAPATFQRVMNLILHGLNWKSCLVYLDDIIVFSSTFDEHLERLGQVLDKLEEANIFLKLPKCTFCTDTVEYLGHIVSSQGVMPDPKKIERLQGMKSPSNIKEVRSFLGLAGYYRRFVHKFAEITSPIAELLHKDHNFNWTDECQQAFDKIISILTTAPVLAYPDFSLPFRLQADACKTSIGAVLSQIGKDGVERPIAYYSRLLTAAELKYGTTEHECLAVVASMKHFRPYLWGKTFLIQTDHRALKWLSKTKDSNDKLYRWFLKMVYDGYDYVVEHRPGQQHGNADALSRLMCKWDTNSETLQYWIEPTNPIINSLHTKLKKKIIYKKNKRNIFKKLYSRFQSYNSSLFKGFQPLEFSEPLKQLQIEQTKCRVTSALRKYKEENIIPTDRSLKQIVMTEGRNLIISNNILCRIAPPQYGMKNIPILQAVIPTTLRSIVMQATHDSLIGGGHMAFDKTYTKAKERWWWPHMYQDLKHWIASCETCCKMKKNKNKKKGSLQPIVVHEPFELLGMDIVGEMPMTAQGHRFILVITDHLSKWATAIPMKSITTIDVAQALLEKVILAGHGVPARILTDRGSNFNSQLAHELYKLLKISKSTTTAYHPQCDGHTERFNKTLCHTLAKLMLEHPMDWDELLPFCTFDYNTSIQKSTKFTPYYIIYGREPRVPAEYMLGHINYPIPVNLQTYTKQLVERLKEALHIARSNMYKAQTNQQINHDLYHGNPKVSFEKGDQVYIESHTRPKPGTSSKLKEEFIGPYLVTKVLSSTNYLIKGDDFPEQSVHISRLQRYIPRDTIFQKLYEPQQEVQHPISYTKIDNKVTFAEEQEEIPADNQDMIIEKIDDKIIEIQDDDQNTPLVELEIPSPPIINNAEQKIANDISEIEEVSEEQELTPTSIDEDDPMVQILSKGGTEIEPQYLIQWKSGDRRWILEKDVDSKLLIDYIKINGNQQLLPHDMIKLLLNTIELYLNQIRRSNKLTIAAIKRKIRSWIGYGGTFLKSKRTIMRLTEQINKAEDKDEIISILQTWITSPNYTFIEEWDYAGK